jgi:type IV pilus assembly protein PilE
LENNFLIKPSTMSFRLHSRGFTLIELMITVAVIGILAAIAYPSYQGQIRKSQRADAQSTLMSMAGKQQQFLLDTRSYADTLAGLNFSVPTSVTKNYNVTIAATNSATAPATFTITATPTGGQAADTCAVLTLDQAGTKTPNTCW